MGELTNLSVLGFTFTESHVISHMQTNAGHDRSNALQIALLRPMHV